MRQLLTAFGRRAGIAENVFIKIYLITYDPQLC